MYFILIDSGTTNSRARLVDEELNIIDVKKEDVGVRNTALDGNNDKLKICIKGLIKSIIDDNNIEIEDVKNVVASGMITSEMGLIEIDHVKTPVNKEILKDKIVKKQYEYFYNLEFIFIPGVKNNISDKDLYEVMDMMRGEEVEAIGLIENLNLDKEGLIVIPGSHTKFIKIDEDKNIESSYSTLTGELIDVVRKNTILSKAINKEFEYDVNMELVYKGFNSSKLYGLTRSFYNVRLMDMFTDHSESDIINYYLGAIIYEDIKSIEKLSNIEKLNWIVITGNNSLKEIFYEIFKNKYENINIIKVNKEDMEKSIVKGAIEIIK